MSILTKNGEMKDGVQVIRGNISYDSQLSLCILPKLQIM